MTALLATTALPGPAPRSLGLWMARASRTDLLALLQRLQREHGPLCVTRVQHQRLADVFDPGLARTLLVDHAAALQRWPTVPQVLARYHGPRSLLVAEDAASWQLLHEVLGRCLRRAPSTPWPAPSSTLDGVNQHGR